MDCKITSTKRRWAELHGLLRRRSGRLRGRAGFTLIETMVSVGIASIAIVVLASLSYYSARSFSAMANYVDLDFKSRIALDVMSKEIRQTRRLLEHTKTSLTFEDADGSKLKYEYDSKERTLTRIKDGVPDAEPLLTECDSLSFSIFQRNPVGGTYDQYPTATASTCKLVQLNWTCSRQILGEKVNTESVQSAKIVIRKQ
jgi:prepilin-type N-terminal cleavage/methylation domain-containing protein